MSIQDKFAQIPDSARVSVLWPNAEFICDAGEIKAEWVRLKEAESLMWEYFNEAQCTCADDSCSACTLYKKAMKISEKQYMASHSAPEVEVRDVGSAVGVTSEQSPFKPPYAMTRNQELTASGHMPMYGRGVRPFALPNDLEFEHPIAQQLAKTDGLSTANAYQAGFDACLAVWRSTIDTAADTLTSNETE